MMSPSIISSAPHPYIYGYTPTHKREPLKHGIRNNGITEYGITEYGIAE
jgi:hypothetical protein